MTSPQKRSWQVAAFALLCFGIWGGLGLVLGLGDEGARTWLFVGAGYLLWTLGNALMFKRIASAERARGQTLNIAPSDRADRARQRRTRRDQVARIAILGLANVAFMLAFDFAFDFADWLQAYVVIGLLVVLIIVAWLTYKVRRDSHPAV